MLTKLNVVRNRRTRHGNRATFLAASRVAVESSDLIRAFHPEFISHIPRPSVAFFGLHGTTITPMITGCT